MENSLKLEGSDFFNHREVCEAIFNRSAEAILLVDIKGVIVHLNPRAEQLFGYPQQELTGANINVLVPQKYRGAHDGHVEGYNQNPHPRTMAEGFELKGMRKDGSSFPLIVSLSPAKIEGNPITVALVIDITEQTETRNKLKRLNSELEEKVNVRTKELARLVNKLEKANQELTQAEEEVRQSLEVEKELNELKSRFVSMASHEFRTPLSTILSSVSLLEKYGTETKFDEKREKHYLRIKSNVRNLTNILNDFLSLDKLQEGKVACSPSRFDLKEMAAEVREDLSPQLKTGQEFLYEFEGEETVLLDEGLVKNVLLNLLSNAIKYSPEDKKIFLRIAVLDRVRIEIEDQGIGIPEEEKSHMFERFFRAKNATNIQGTGLGLTIVKRYLDLMKGEISFESEYMVGTTFIVTLPKEL